ncbi:endonuclease domain-containing protein [Solitalea koreensis]|uniref:Very-short-patch-repair endonuclease n=1 Tax=Solitalea koreensis TaxID=543615 RepID=A0A521C957_9SPHI|nr:DUF559 domain-containing protein [Solitalea koreensis]SMO55905.1 Very-short-patch-repair endonuclease [Solitalea koreensis]
MKPHPDLSYLKKIRTDLHNNQLVAELELWKFLKNRRLKKRLFKRKHRVGEFVFDFYCPEEHLAVGLVSDQDKDKELFLKDQEMKCIMIECKNVFENIEEVLNTIAAAFNNSKNEMVRSEI